MTAIKLQAFAGQIPIQDDRLLPDTAAVQATNTWLYSGRIEGTRTPKLVHTLLNTSAKSAFRIPKAGTGAVNIVDSYWLEFNSQDVDVVRGPTDDDTFERFYWAGEGDNTLGTVPRYNTKARIFAGQSPFILGVPAPTTSPVVTTSPASSTFAIQSRRVRVTANPVIMTYTKSSSPSTSIATRYVTVTPSRLTMLYRNSNNIETPDAETLSAAGTVTPGVSSETSSNLIVARAYTYTWVTAYGEEGPPAEPVVNIGKQGDHWDVGLTAPTTPQSANRNITTARIYRTITSQQGQATFYFVADVPIATLTYRDDLPDVDVAANNTLQSTLWSAPPEDLRGMASMPNGMVVGFRGNEVWFCEPYRLHAWPSSYTLTTSFSIVGIGVMGQTVIVCTDAGIYAVTGTAPSVMSMAQIAPDACLSRGSIVPFKDGVYFAGAEGIMRATPGGVDNVTARAISKDYWLKNHAVGKIQAVRLGNSYYGGSAIAAGCFESTAFETTAFEQLDYTGSYSGFMIDPTDPRMAYVRWENSLPLFSLANDPWSQEILLVRGGRVYHLDTTAPSYETYRWRSKVFEFDKAKNFGAARVFWRMPADAQLNATPGVMRLYAGQTPSTGDMRLVMSRQLIMSGEPMRLPSGFLAEFWQVEFEGVAQIYSAQIASTMKELISV